MAFKVSCGECHVGGSGYKISLKEMEVDSAGLGLKEVLHPIQLLTLCCQ